MKHVRWIRLTASALILAASIAACDVGPVTFTEARSGVATDALAVQVKVVRDDSAVAGALGWEDGVPGATVRIFRENPRQPKLERVEGADSLVTDSAGVVVIRDLRRGIFRVSASRRLEPEQVAEIRDRWPTIRAVGGGTRTSPGDTVTLWVQANDTGSLVISEAGFLNPPISLQGGGYDFGGFVELYNNSGHTIYLDGKIIGEPYSKDFETNVTTCADQLAFQNDSTGLWTRYMQAFPGSGRDHPLLPGETVVIATDAVDHREVNSELWIDLRDADFEFWGGAGDVDNPSVPNMEQVGLQSAFGGHGLSIQNFLPGDLAIFIAEPVEVDALPRGRPPIADAPHVKIPADAVLDVMTTLSTESSVTANLCSDRLHDRFEQQPLAWFGNQNTEVVPSRRSIGTANGRTILLDTNTSQADLFNDPRSPGHVREKP